MTALIINTKGSKMLYFCDRSIVKLRIVVRDRNMRCKHGRYDNQILIGHVCCTCMTSCMVCQAEAPDVVVFRIQNATMAALIIRT